MKNMEELKLMLMDELDQIIAKGEISFNDLDNIQKMTSSIKNIDRIIMADRYSDHPSDTISDQGRSYESRSRSYGKRYHSYDEDSGMLSDKLEDMISDGRMGMNDKKILKEALEIIRR